MSTYPKTRRRRRQGPPDYSVVVPLEVHSNETTSGLMVHPVALRKHPDGTYSAFFYKDGEFLVAEPWGTRPSKKSIAILHEAAFKVEPFKTGVKFYLNEGGMDLLRKSFPDPVDRHPMKVL